MVLSDLITNSQPFRNGLVAVHCDELPLEDFVAQQVSGRVSAYTTARLPVYLLSTMKSPHQQSGVIAIPSFGKLDDGYGLDRQLEVLFDKLSSYVPRSTMEVIGVSWFICVSTVHVELLRRGFKADINYEGTDHVVDYKGLNGIPMKVNGKPIPVPRSEHLERYQAYLRAAAHSSARSSG